jgi:hypothetical protein
VSAAVIVRGPTLAAAPLLRVGRLAHLRPRLLGPEALMHLLRWARLGPEALMRLFLRPRLRPEALMTLLGPLLEVLLRARLMHGHGVSRGTAGVILPGGPRRTI